MGRYLSEGTCNFCHATVKKSVVSRHLVSCRSKATADAISAGQPPRKTTIFHIVVEGRGQPEYWIHLDAAANARLIDLDAFLRNIWLECCGHLSAFRIEGQSYSVQPMDEFNDKSMAVPLAAVLYPGLKFSHEYDFGTTTELSLRVVSERDGAIPGRSIQPLARNNAPPITCGACGQAATQVCSQCAYSREGWLCNACAAEHACGEDMFLPVVNSPRVGMCGYTG